MKIGVCTDINLENIKLIKAAGFDYAEGHCQQMVKKPFEVIEEIKEFGFPIYAANCFIGIPVVGPEKNPEEIRAYLETLFERATYLGLKYFVFGSSAARRIPDGMTLEEGRSEIVDFLKNYVVPLCEKYKTVTIAIEPLRPEECNAVNTVEDGIEIAKRVNSPYVKVLADLSHLFVQNEDPEKLRGMSEWIVHAHTSNPDPDPSLQKKRIYPTADDEYKQADFIEPLIAAGVEQCSIEAEDIDFEADLAKAFEVLKKYR